ncbi:hypothetical protein GJAV_G00175270 [Gymnothorax javanicus]|nr:hypothetical protein GJAV_G00175270 [Gymnothorax javanicus]
MSLDQEDAVSSGPDTGHKSLSPSDERSFTSSDSRLNFRASFTLSDLHEELVRGMQEQFDREIEELRSENDYLKDELVELQAEMLEMRDEYLEEDMYQLQVLRQQLDQANKNCRILQYRLHKAERHCLKVAQTGRMGGEPLCTLEQDLKVAKDVSIRLRGELDSVERKRAELDQENIDLRERLLELEVARQVQQAEMDKKRENSLKRKGSRSSKSERKHLPQEDSADLRCQLHFAKEESALMCRKLAKLARENEGMSEELARFRSLYGRVEDLMEGQAAQTREAEVRGRLQLVEEEANLLSRRIVELEVENRGLRAEMEEMKHPEQQHGEWPQGGPISRASIGKVDEQSTTLAGKLGHGRERPGHSAEPENLSRGASKTVIHLRPLVSWVESSKGALVGCGFEDRTDYAHLDHGGLTSEVGNNPALLKIQEQAYLLHSAICLLTASNSNHLHSPIYTLACPVSPSPHSPIEQGIMEKSHSKVHTLAHWLKTLQAQLQAFMEGIEVLKGFGSLEVQNGDALLSPVDAQDGESSGELKECQCQDQSEWRVRGQGAEEEIDICEHRVATCTQTRQGPDAVELGLVNSPLLELKGVLQELTAEMLVERRVSGDLAQKLASAQSEWEAERTEFQSQINQDHCNLICDLSIGVDSLTSTW